ncbi:MAG: VOC family protein [Thermomicrobiales bacterium]
MGNKIVHIEINGSNRSEIGSWYGSIFNWKIESHEEYDFTTFGTGDGTGGGFATTEDAKPVVIPYISVDDLQATIDAILAKGGTLKEGITEMPFVTYAICVDPFGHQIGLMLDPDNARD